MWQFAGDGMFWSNPGRSGKKLHLKMATTNERKERKKLTNQRPMSDLTKIKLTNQRCLFQTLGSLSSLPRLAGTTDFGQSQRNC